MSKQTKIDLRTTKEYKDRIRRVCDYQTNGNMAEFIIQAVDVQLVRIEEIMDRRGVK